MPSAQQAGKTASSCQTEKKIFIRKGQTIITLLTLREIKIIFERMLKSNLKEC